jgi:hypothetical protein
MPEITINENGELGAGEDDIRFTGKMLDVLTESKSTLVKLRSYC